MEKAFPKIRVFISSTFLDMQKERDVLSLEVFPVVKGVCDQLGVAFNVIDLRWGITEEDQAQGSVIDLCLDEIQHCKPYFIGLIGNRYGWIPDTFDPDLKEKFQFIKEDEDRSVTELEMVWEPCQKRIATGVSSITKTLNYLMLKPMTIIRKKLRF